MEQAAALTMSDKTAPPSREGTPSADQKDTPTTATASNTDTTKDPAADSADGATPTASGSAPIAQRLYTGGFEEEVGQVMKGLGSFWGGFKARSALTLTTLKADLDKTVAQVQTDLRQLQDAKVEVTTKDQETWEREQAEERERAHAREEEERERKAAERATRAKGKGKAREVDGEGGGGEEGEDAEDSADGGAQATAAALFNRISSSTTQLQGSLQSALASTLAAAKANPTVANMSQLRAQLAENLRLQTARENITLSLHQAETLAGEYMKKGEGFLKETQRVGGNIIKDAEKWVEDNVKIVPPPGGEYVPSTGWDTGEWYAFSTVSAPPPAASDAGASASRAPVSSAALAGSRKEALLRRLREDKDLLMVDPASEAETQERRDEFAAWVAAKWPAAAREDEEAAVGGIRMALVPEHLTDEQFWQRYLFHKDMIEAADAKRKLLLQATEQETEADDFSWDDDEDAEPKDKDDSSTPTPVASVPSGPVEKKDGKDKDGKDGKDKEASATSPRDSEESYDLVSGRASTAAAEDSDDSDWE